MLTKTNTFVWQSSREPPAGVITTHEERYHNAVTRVIVRAQKNLANATMLTFPHESFKVNKYTLDFTVKSLTVKNG